MNLWLRCSLWIWGFLAALPLAAQAQVNLKGLDQGMTGPRSQVMVLGSVHLRYLPDDFNPESLKSLLDRLATFKPQIITIELQSGLECDLFARHPDKLGSSFNCVATDKAQAATGLDLPSAIAQVDKTLKAWPAQPTPAQRRQLAALYLAAGNPPSALTQWLQLPEAERHAGDTLKGELVDVLIKLERNKDEIYQIAARLAARLGLPGVVATDDHTGDNIDVHDAKAWAKSLEAAWAASSAELKEWERAEEPVLKKAPDLLPLYRHINGARYQQLRADANVGTAMRANSPDGYPQWFVAGWEIRNLRMVANIRETFRERPGARVLSVVGASHKAWFDSWLGQMQGVEIVDTAVLLK